jgi:hypothetical protein
VNARVPFPTGALAKATNARLMSGDAEVPAQFSAEAQWPDQSVQWLDVDFNASLTPAEFHTYRVEYGAGVKPASPPRGLTVTEDSTTVQAGQVKFSKLAVPLILSVKYRGEDIAPGANGIAVTDASGVEHDLTNADAPKIEILKPGPLYVMVRYTGRIAIDANYRTPYSITVEMPNSKSWVKVTAAVEDSQKRLRELVFHSPLALGALPWVWDFGTDRWTYGSLHAGTDAVVLVQAIKPGAATEWHVDTSSNAKAQPFETGTLESPKRVRWGHIQDGKEGIAFGLETPDKQAGTSKITLRGNGEVSFSFAPATPVTEHRITVYQHFVTAPVQIGAVTTPSSMLAPLDSYCDPKQYTLSGLKPR